MQNQKWTDSSIAEPKMDRFHWIKGEGNDTRKVENVCYLSYLYAETKNKNLLFWNKLFSMIASNLWAMMGYIQTTKYTQLRWQNEMREWENLLPGIESRLQYWEIEWHIEVKQVSWSVFL